MRQTLPKKLCSQNGAVLLLALIVAVFLSLLLGAAMLRSDVQIKEVFQRSQKQKAFYAAESGVDFAIYNLRQSSSWKPGQGEVPAIVNDPLEITVEGIIKTIGYYSITVENAPDFNGWESRWIISTGRDPDKMIARTVKARVIVESPTKFLISTLGPLHITSGSQLNADTLAKDIYFDINTSLPDPDNQIHVNGDIFYINSKTGENNPAVIFGADHTIQKSPSITFAGVDLSRYQILSQDSQAQNEGYYSAGDLTINLNNLSVFNQNPPEPFHPKIIFADGDIHISGQYDSSILIVAAGNVYIDGDIVADASQATIPQIGLFAKGDVIIPQEAGGLGDLNIEGFILADGGTPSSKGSFIAEGSKYSKGQLNFKGSISVRGNGPSAVDLNVYNVRNYDFNPNLSNNRTIPFTPFIVNTVQWQECPNPVCP